jgi:UDP-2,4-diacetamido-2,4,6-trideoxy-beta-L-altropyranose hydrolase
MLARNVVFRTDASDAIGTGHVIRCLTLATALREDGATIAFVCRAISGHLCDLIETHDFVVHRLPGPGERMGGAREAVLPAIGWEEDADQTRAAIAAMAARPDWLVVDHYGLDLRWEQALRASADRIMVIDDLADRTHDCDLLLDQNQVAGMDTRYADKVPPACRVLLGPSYALLQAIYADLHDRVLPREGPIRRIFIFTSGADRDNLTGRLLESVLSLRRPDIEVDVAVASSHFAIEAIRGRAASHAHVHVHTDLPTLAILMARADVAIGASGGASWERLCLGLPALVITMSENQRPIADEQQRLGLIRWLGHCDEVDELTLRQAVADAVQQGLDADWSKRCRAMVDGRGAERVCAAMTIRADTPLLARHATITDAEVCQAGTPAGSTTAGAGARREWFRGCLKDIENCHLYVVETAPGVALGHVRFTRTGTVWEIGHELAPVCADHLGPVVVAAALLALRHDEGPTLSLARLSHGLSWPSDAESPRGAPRPRDPVAAPLHVAVCADQSSWINAYVPELLLGWLEEGHQISWAADAATLAGGDVCFYLGYGRIVAPELLARFKNNVVVHESDLPSGRGWSPLTWQVLEGADSVMVTLFEAVAAIDSGPIYLQERIRFDGTELVDDLRRHQAQATIRLCRASLAEYPRMLTNPCEQAGQPTYYRRRRPEDGQLNPDLPLRELFNLLRVSDSHRYPAWFELAGARYTLHIERM